MGKNLIQQARGRGGPTYRAPSFNYVGAAKHRKEIKDKVKGIVKELLHCPGHSAPLARIAYEDGESCLLIAPEGIKQGDSVSYNIEEISPANTLHLKDIPEGTLIYNVESVPGDGGKFARASGTFAKILAKSSQRIVIQLPSKKQKDFNPSCRANIGIVAAGGRPDKPFLKAGVRHFRMKAKNKLYPSISGTSQNAVDHPFGTSRSSKKGHPTIAPKNAPPGKNVGKIRPSRTGWRRK